MAMRRGIRFIPDLPQEEGEGQLIVEGVPVFYDAKFHQLAVAKGFFPFRKKILIGTKLWGLDWRARLAILYHEAHHCNARHKEKRIALVVCVALCPLVWPSIPRLFRRMAHGHEYAADQFAKSKGFGLDLARALRAYPESRRKDDVMYHPPLDERCRRLEAP